MILNNTNKRISIKERYASLLRTGGRWTEGKKEGGARKREEGGKEEAVEGPAELGPGPARPCTSPGCPRAQKSEGEGEKRTDPPPHGFPSRDEMGRPKRTLYLHFLSFTSSLAAWD